MIKQLSSLEALERIKNTQVKNATSPFDYVYIKDERKHELDIIETALKRLESVDKVGEMFCCDVDKKLKALEIIKEKEINIQTFKKWIIDRDWSYEDYLTEIGDINVTDYYFSKIPLTQEEFDLLKEVFKWD